MKQRNMASVLPPLCFNWKRRRNINKNCGISLKWAVVALYIIYGMLNYWHYIRLARVCKTQQKHTKGSSVPSDVSNIWGNLICILEILKTLSLASSLSHILLEPSQTWEFSLFPWIFPWKFDSLSQNGKAIHVSPNFVSSRIFVNVGWSLCSYQCLKTIHKIYILSPGNSFYFLHSNCEYIFILM